MSSIEKPKVRSAFEKMPPPVRERMYCLRSLILEVASEIEGGVEETLKWQAPSYLARAGSTVRLEWKASSPDEYGVYFHCATKLVDTFRELYREQFQFEKNRAIIFRIGDKVPEKALKHCIKLALTYHRVKHLPLLGV